MRWLKRLKSWWQREDLSWLGQQPLKSLNYWAVCSSYATFAIMSSMLNYTLKKQKLLRKRVKLALWRLRPTWRVVVPTLSWAPAWKKRVVWLLLVLNVMKVAALTVSYAVVRVARVIQVVHSFLLLLKIIWCVFSEANGLLLWWIGWVWKKEKWFNTVWSPRASKGLRKKSRKITLVSVNVWSNMMTWWMRNAKWSTNAAAMPCTGINWASILLTWFMK